jgi:hypothetical protein
MGDINIGFVDDKKIQTSDLFLSHFNAGHVLIYAFIFKFNFFLFDFCQHFTTSDNTKYDKLTMLHVHFLDRQQDF